MDKLFDIASEIFEVERGLLSLDTSREAFEKWDSLAHLNLVAEFEEEFGVVIPFEDIVHIKKLEDFLKYLGK
jgi:Acyl carrier protein